MLEVLVAFAILSISLGILYQAMGNSLRNLALSDQYTQAMMIAESKLAEMGSKTPLTSATDSGEEEPGYAWRVTVEPFAAGDSGTNPPDFEAFHVHVEVSWQEGRKSRVYVLDSLRLNNPKGVR